MTRKELLNSRAYNISITAGEYYSNNPNSDSMTSYEEGAKWADKTMIEKAEKWLENFLEKTIQKPSINDGYTSDTIDLAELTRRRLIEKVLYDFKKAMEE